MNPLTIIIPAAGNSSRLGQAKQLVRYGAQSLLTRQIRLAQQITPNVICVLGAHASAIENQVREELTNEEICQFIINDSWETGMGVNIAAGVKAMPSHTQSAMILLCDQWQLIQKDLLQLVAAGQQSPDHIIVSQYDKIDSTAHGAPVLFPASEFESLRHLTHQGAKFIYKKKPDKVKFVLLERAIHDLDTPEQLTVFNNTIQQ